MFPFVAARMGVLQVPQHQHAESGLYYLKRRCKRQMQIQKNPMVAVSGLIASRQDILCRSVSINRY